MQSANTTLFLGSSYYYSDRHWILSTAQSWHSSCPWWSSPSHLCQDLYNFRPWKRCYRAIVIANWLKFTVKNVWMLKTFINGVASSFPVVQTFTTRKEVVGRCTQMSWPPLVPRHSSQTSSLLGVSSRREHVEIIGCDIRAIARLPDHFPPKIHSYCVC